MGTAKDEQQAEAWLVSTIGIRVVDDFAMVNGRVAWFERRAELFRPEDSGRICESDRVTSDS